MWNDLFLRIAAAIADGKPTDWSEETKDAPAAARRIIEELQTISQVAAAQVASGESGEGGDGPPEDFEVAPIGGTWKHLELLQKLGEGSHATVYRARDPQLERHVALKLMRQRSSDAKHLTDSIVREGKLLARVKHPNVATIYGTANQDGQVGIWMELVEGQSIRELIVEQGRLSAREAALVGVDVARACAAVHAQGILHRDIKAQNLMRERGGRIVLMDFGIGEDLLSPADPASVTESSIGADIARDQVRGTPLYLAPELLGGAPASVQSDVYALGVLLYFMVTGSFPLVADSLRELRRAHENGDVQPLCDIRPDIPAAYSRVVDRALAAAPEDRPATMGQVERLLGAFLATVDSGALVASRVDAVAGISSADPGLWRRGRRWNGTAKLGAGAIVVVAAAYLGWWWGSGPVAIPEGASVLLAEITQPGEAPDAELNAVRELLRMQLDQSAYYQLVPDARMAELRQQMRLDGSEPLSDQSAREMAWRQGSLAIVSGQITRLFTNYRLDMTIERVGDVPTARGAVQHQRFDASGKDEILLAIDEAGDWVRSELGEAVRSRAIVNVPTRDATSAHWQAISQYVDAMRLPATERTEAISLLESAIAIDTGFAVAHAALGNLLSWTDVSAAFHHWSAALGISATDRLTVKERFQIEATAALHGLELERALHAYESWSDAYPHDYPAVFGRFYTLQELGDDAAAIAVLEASKVEWPDEPLTTSRLAELYVDTGNEAAAVRHIARLRELYGDSAFWVAIADSYEGRLLFSRGEYEQSLAAFERMTRSADPHWRSRGYLTTAAMLGELGRHEAAADKLREGIRIDASQPELDGLRARKYLALAYVAHQQGDRTAVPELVAQALELSADPWLVGRAAMILGVAGFGGRVAPVLETVDDVDVPLLAVARRRISGEMALADGRTDDAVELFRRAGADDLPNTEREYLARALAARGSTHAQGEALQLYLRIVNDPARTIRSELVWEVMPGFWADSVFHAYELAVSLGDDVEADRARALYRALRGSSDR